MKYSFPKLKHLQVGDRFRFIWSQIEYIVTVKTSYAICYECQTNGYDYEVENWESAWNKTVEIIKK